MSNSTETTVEAFIAYLQTLPLGTTIETLGKIPENDGSENPDDEAFEQFEYVPIQLPTVSPRAARTSTNTCGLMDYRSIHFKGDGMYGKSILQLGQHPRR